MSNATDAIKELKRTAMFSCQNNWCGMETTFPYDMLRVYDGEPICEYCYDGLCLEEPWLDLKAFEPFADIEKALALEFNHGYVIACCTMATYFSDPYFGASLLELLDLTEEDMAEIDLSESNIAAIERIKTI